MAKRVSPAEASELMKQGWQYLDVRSVPEFEGGHPAGAFNVPLLHNVGGRLAPNPDFQRVIGAAFADKTAQLVVGCKMGGRSAQAAALLEAAGYTNVIDVRGGFAGERDAMGRVSFPGWEGSSLPVATVAEPGKSYADLSKKG